jgi:hypothetical protein
LTWRGKVRLSIESAEPLKSALFAQHPVDSDHPPADPQPAVDVVTQLAGKFIA